MIRVLHMGLDDTAGGIETFLLNISRHIDSSKFQFGFLCYGSDPAYGDELSALGGELIRLPERRDVLKYRSVLKGASRRFDIVHLHKNTAIDWLPLLWLKRCRIVIHSHNSAHSLPFPYCVMHEIGRFAYGSGSCRRLACSEKAGEWLYGPRASFTVFPNSIEGRRFSYSESDRWAIRRELFIPEDSFVIGAVGRLVRQKNYEFLIKVFARVHRVQPSSLMVIVGCGEQREMLELIARDLGIRDSIIFMGGRPDVNRVYSAFDCFCAPSIYEGFSIVALEAQFSGLRTFVSDSFPDEVFATGLISPHKLVSEEWVNALVGYMRSGQAREGLSVQDGRGLRKYDIETASLRLEEIYRELIHG